MSGRIPDEQARRPSASLERFIEAYDLQPSKARN